MKTQHTQFLNTGNDNYDNIILVDLNEENSDLIYAKNNGVAKTFNHYFSSVISLAGLSNFSRFKSLKKKKMGHYWLVSITI